MNRVAFIKTVADRIESDALFGKNARIVVGVSGGPDSMALLHGLLDLNTEHGYALDLHIAHLNHKLRGESGEKDAGFVQAAADNLQLPCTIECRDIQSLSGDGKGSIEEIGRRERYAFLERVCLQCGAKLIAVAHQRDDDAETILHRILRGTGLRGLAGIPRKRVLREGSDVQVVRPLLSINRADILAYLGESGIPSREDRTNADQSKMRNRIRNAILPMLESDVNPQVRDALIRLGEQARWLEDYFRATVHRTLETLVISHTDQALILNAVALAKKSRIVQTELIRRAIASFQLGEQDLGFSQMLSVLDLVSATESGKALNLPGGMKVSKQYDRLTFSLPTDEPRETIASEIAVHVPGQTVLPIRRMQIDCQIDSVDAGTLAGWRERQRKQSMSAPRTNKYADQVLEEWVDAEEVHLPLVVRTRAAGDRFWPLGAPGSKKVSEFLIDAKVDPKLRDRVAILCDQLGPIWVIGHRIDERVKLTSNTREVLRLQARPVES
jgi:tRNA(Ile)-lysidine synthase